jgi:hypothetical protein
MQLCWTWRECPETVAYGTPRKRFATIPVTSKQLKFRCLTFSKIRFNALWMFVAPIAPRIITFTSVAMKKKFHPSSMDLSIERKAIETFDYAPVSRVRLALQPKNLGDQGLLLDQNSADLNFWRHRLSRVNVSCDQKKGGAGSHPRAIDEHRLRRPRRRVCE